MYKMDIWGISLFYAYFLKNKNTGVVYFEDLCKKLLIIVLFMCER